MKLLIKVAIGLLLFLGVALIMTAATVRDQTVPETPLMRVVDPARAKPGETVVVKGDALDKSRVAEVYLTDGAKDFKVEIIEQTNTSITFKILANTPPGRFGLMVLMAREPKFIEQPVYLTVLGELPSSGI
jgi:hypothetical protein